MAIRNPISSFKVILVFVVLTIIGLALISELSVKLSPSQELPQINISFSMSGNPPRVVELEVTSKLESMLSRMKGVESLHSTSGNGWGYISIRLDRHTNIDAARFEVSTIIRQAWPSLPAGVSYPVILLSRSDDNGDRPFMTYTVNAPSTPVLIQQFAENQLKPRLGQIEGVNKVDVRGAVPLEWQLQYDYDILKTLGISINEIKEAVNNYLRKEFLGTVPQITVNDEKRWIRVALVSDSQFEETPDLANIGIKRVDGRLITVANVAEINHMESSPQSYYRINGLNSIYLSITADESVNQLTLSKQIKKELATMSVFFPAGYEIHLVYDATEYIKEELDKIYFRSGLTLLILLLFVLLTYRNWKYTLLIVLSLFINIAVAVIFYYLFKVEIQLYSLAGITISLTLIIDNTIIMSDQILRRGNKKAFLAILMATLTTIGALVIIFFLEEKMRLNLQDFAWVIIINLTLSLLIALFLVPALLDKLQMLSPARKRRRTRKLFSSRFYVRFNVFYASFCRGVWRWKVLVILFMILSFGLPVFLLPEKIEKEGTFADLYNHTLGSVFYQEKMKPYVDKALGGTLRLFVEKVYNGSYFADRGEETTLYVTATLPNGATIDQMNELIKKMESYISQFPEVKQFQTRIENARRASINIYFTKENQFSSFPYQLKSKLITKSIQLGGGSWGVFGLGDGFSNDVRESAGSYRVELYGFNYDELLSWAEVFKDSLREHRRIKEVAINSEFSWYKDDYEEFGFEINKEKLAQQNIQPIQLFNSLKSVFGQNIYAGSLYGEYYIKFQTVQGV